MEVCCDYYFMGGWPSRGEGYLSRGSPIRFHVVRISYLKKKHIKNGKKRQEVNSLARPENTDRIKENQKTSQHLKKPENSLEITI